MALIVPWKRPQGWQARPLAPGEAHGQILLFTGVRYQRGEQETQEQETQEIEAQETRESRPPRRPRGRRRRA